MFFEGLSDLSEYSGEFDFHRSAPYMNCPFPVETTMIRCTVFHLSKPFFDSSTLFLGCIVIDLRESCGQYEGVRIQTYYPNQAFIAFRCNAKGS